VASELLVDRPEFDEQAEGWGFDGVHRAIQLQHIAASQSQLQVLPAVTPAVLANAVERRKQLRRTFDHAVQAAAGEDRVADLEQVLGSRIEIADCQGLVEQEHG
jgi:hypothetical protein